MRRLGKVLGCNAGLWPLLAVVPGLNFRWTKCKSSGAAADCVLALLRRIFGILCQYFV